MLLFEGSEKKLEIILKPEVRSLRLQGESFCKSIVQKAKIQIINSISNSHTDAYLLSESSLFVYDHRLILITCGQSQLVSSVLYFLKHYPDSQISSLFFQRKNEFFPLNQRTHFMHDIRKLSKKIKGKYYRFGDLHERYFYLFHMDQSYYPTPEDQTVEILMYGLKGELSNILNQASQASEIRKYLNWSECFPGFSIQDHIFEPSGYSLNAIREKEYFTVHVTPQEIGFYISFETNIQESPKDIIKKVILLLQPTSFDTIITTPSHVKADKHCEWPNYFISNHYYKALTCGFNIEFLSFKYKQTKPYSPYELDKGVDNV